MAGDVVESVFANCDSWGAAEWFDRLANAIREQDKAALAEDGMAFATYRNIASSSATRLVRDYEPFVRARLAELEAGHAGGGVVVRPLVWVSHAWGCEAEGGRYRIEDNGTNWTDDRYWLFANVGLLSSSRSKFASLDEAKAAAQFDYEARILAALAPSPSAGEIPKRWPFVESPGDFTARLASAFNDLGGDMLAAVRNVLIENPPTLATPPATPVQPTASVEAVRYADFLDEAARYFENRPVKGEDSAHWSNVTNAETCRKIAVFLRASITPAPTQGALQAAVSAYGARTKNAPCSICGSSGCDHTVRERLIGELVPGLPDPVTGEPTPSPAPVSAPSPAGGVREAMETRGPYEPRICKGTPADCCDYGVVSLSEGREVCRVWREQDARAIAAALSSPATPEPVSAPATDGEVVEAAGALLNHLRAHDFNERDPSGELNERMAELSAALSNPAPGHVEAVPVAWPWGYQQTFDAISAAVSIYGGGTGINISVEKFRSALSHPATGEKPAPATGKEAPCDCERGHNGIGLAGRECDCRPATPKTEDQSHG